MTSPSPGRRHACLAAALLMACDDGPPPAEPAEPPLAPPIASAPLEPAIREALGGDWEAHYFDAAVDLDEDGRPEAVALVAGPRVCGTGGCPVFVFTPLADGYRLVASISVAQPPVRLSPRRSHGWRNLVVGIGGGGLAAGNAELAFDGTSYPGNPTVPPALPAPDLEGTEVLIPEFASYRDGKPVAAGSLGGTSWRLVKIMSMDDTVYTPNDPSQYTLEFGTDGSMQVRSDCNRGTGSWSSKSAAQLEFGPIAATQALCPPDSLHDRYLGQFPWVRSYVLKDGNLFLATMADGSIIEFEPITRAGAAATVLGQEVQAADAGEMQEILLTRLFEAYAAAQGIEATEAEIAAFVANLERVKQQDRADREARLAELGRRLESADLPASERQPLEAERAALVEQRAALETDEELTAEEAVEVERMRRDMAREIIVRWKLNRELYRQYGGRIIAQQLGPEPLDGYRQFLEQQQREGAFSIQRKEFEAEFWRYFRDDSIHSFFDPDSREKAEAFQVPPWERRDE